MITTRETNKKKNTPFERALSVVLALLLVFSCFGTNIPAAIAETTPGGGTVDATPVSFNSYTLHDLDIYSYLHYSDANAVIQVSGGRYLISGANEASDRNIVIGNQQKDGDDRTNAYPYDIPVALQSLDMVGALTIKPVGTTDSEGAYSNKTMLTVEEASSLGKLVVEKDAQLDITLNANLTVNGDIELGTNSTLTVTGTGTLAVTGAFKSQGTVALNGGTINAQQGLSAQTLTVSGATVNAHGNAISATDTISLDGGRVEDASLFGYKDVPANGGPKTLTLTGTNTFNNVRAVGCSPESSIRVSIEGLNTIATSGGTQYCNDYTITYMLDDGEISPQNGWPVAYRVMSNDINFSSVTIQGYHTVNADDTSTYVPGGSVPLLTDYEKPGYVHQGWKIEGSSDTIKSFSESKGEVTLFAVMEAGAVTVRFDRGYDPDRYTNNAEPDGSFPSRVSEEASKLKETIALPTVTRFGYVFAGWRVIKEDSSKVLPENTTSYTIEYDDCVIDGEKAAVTLEAQWRQDTFNFKLFLGASDITSENDLLISVDGGAHFVPFNELNNSGVTVSGHNVTLSESIAYGDNISAYLQKTFPLLPQGTLPILKDGRAAGTAQQFAGWMSDGGAVGDATVLCYGENGMLSPGRSTLEAYQDSLKRNNPTITAVWGVMSSELTLPSTMPEGWSLTYTGSDGTEKTIEAKQSTGGSVQVQQGTTVILTTKVANPQNFSLWDFKSSAVTEHGNKIIPKEQEYSSGNPELCYVFTMPAANVEATYNKGTDVWVDIACSPILFEENVLSHNNRTVKGFWYADLIDGLTPLFQSETEVLSGTDVSGNELTTKAYFYQWDYADKFCATSNNKATKNQLTLVNALTGGVYFKELNMQMRDTYVDKANGPMIGDVDCESSVKSHTDYTAAKVEEDLKTVNLADYANIVINNSTWQTYSTTLNFQGKNNTVGAIMQDKLQVSVNDINPLILQGTGKGDVAVNLGTAFGNFDYEVSGITVTEYKKEGTTKTDFKYLFYCANQTGCKIKNAIIKAPSKNVHAGCMTDTAKEVSFTDSTVELYSICVFRTAKVSSSYLRVRESVRLGILPIYLEKSSKVVIDGNMEMNYHHWADSDASEGRGMTDNTDNWLVVRGTFCDISNRTWGSGTLICNSLVLGRAGGIKGGTVITNQIINQAVGFWKYDANTHKYGYDEKGSNQTVAAVNNDDNYPFTVYHHKAEGPNTYTFSGGKIYLLGYYRATDGKYDPNVKATEADNPVAAFMNPLLEPDGDLVENPTVNTADVQTAVKESSSRKNNECVVLGNSSDYYSTRRSVEISGSEIYASGNITFYNNTTVSQGTIYCNGSFGSKGDLTVTGGSVTATAVGNAYNLKTTLEDGTVRWKRTDIQDGTVTAGRIGAFEKRVSDANAPTEANAPKSTVTIATGATIEGTPKICHDVYINYIFDLNLFNNNGIPSNKNSLRFNTSWQQDTLFANQTWSNDALSFTPPKAAGEGNANWNWDNLNGKSVDAISAVGIAQKGSADLTENQKAYDRIQMKLYAVKENYDLVFKAGASEIKTITCDGGGVTMPQTDGGKASVKAGGKVVLTFQNATMAQDYTVLWYIDGSKVIHSVLPNRSVSGQISFTMPNSDVEIFAAKEVALDLDLASYTLLREGFRTEANAEPQRGDDSLFHYLGNLVIHQGCITSDIAFNIDTFDNEQMMSPGSNKQTTNKILVDNEFDNSSSDSRTVTLRRIYQNGTPTSRGIDLEAGANAHFLVDGAIRTCRVYVPEGSEISFKGKNKNPSTDAIYPIVNGDALRGNDWASIGNFEGKAGNITLQDLTILGKAQGMWGSLCYSKDDSNNTVTYKNCVYKSAQNQSKDLYQGWYNRSYLAYHAGAVIIDGCKFTFKVSGDWPGSFCDQSKNVAIQNKSVITVTDNGATETDPARPFYLRIRESLVIDDATLNLSLRVPEDGKTYRVYQTANSLPNEVKLKNNANLVLEQRARLKKLVIGDKEDSNNDDRSTVKAGQTGTGYLLCEDIEVNDSANLEAGGIIVSGFYDGFRDPQTQKELQTETDFQKAMAAGKYIFTGSSSSGLIVNGGTVEAKEYITGDVNGKITVNGGTVSAPAIGTTGKLYGYTQYVPRADEKYIYTYDRIPIGTTVDIKGGTVNVTQPEGAGESGAVPYLGGIRTDINVSGGTVNLGEGAVLGITKEQQTTLEAEASTHTQPASNYSGTLKVTGGTINESGASEKGGSMLMPYGTIDVSGDNTAIQVHNMIAHCGSIIIAGATKEAYDNTYNGSDRVHDGVAVNVTKQLSAQYLTIEKGSLVYAASAYADVPKGEKGSITVANGSGTEACAYLYTTDAYGVIGQGEGSSSYTDTSNNPSGLSKNVFGKKVVDVHYIIQPEGVLLEGDIDKVTNPNLDESNGLPHYVVAANEKYQLQDASCSGYRFLGWYDYDPQTKELKQPLTKVDQVDKGNSGTVYLGAKWEKVKVQFEIQVQVDTTECNSNMIFVRDGQDGKKWYKFNQIAEIDYGDPIISEHGIRLTDYTTNTLSIQSVTYNGATIGQEKEGTVVPNTRVSAEMANAYVSQENNSQPLVLVVPQSSMAPLNVLITLDQNKDDLGRPEETSFNLAEGVNLELTSGSNEADEISAYGNVTQTLGSIKAFVSGESGNRLISPTAPGYTFGGWYTDANCQNGPVGFGTSLETLRSNNTTTLYAKWTANTYVVRFSAKTDEREQLSNDGCRWVTKGKGEPGVGAVSNDKLDYTWVYDTKPTDGSMKPLSGSDGEPLKILPTAWREGYVFEDWYYLGEDTQKHFVTDGSELDELIDKLDVGKVYDGMDSSSPEPALTLYAFYRPVEVTYNLNGGKWMTGDGPLDNKEELAYDTPLKGYCEGAVNDGENDYLTLGEAKSADGAKSYYVHSTTSTYFADNKEVVDNDYRRTLARKGYTFKGWKKAGDDTATTVHYGCAPRFDDLSLVADWEANTYSLELHLKDDGYKDESGNSKYESKFNTSAHKTATISGVTVGSKITAASWPETETPSNPEVTWPGKNIWYAHNKGDSDASDENRRFLLGATFAALDPGTSASANGGTGGAGPSEVYRGYASAVTHMLNSKTMFDNGDAFFLPEDNDYQKDIQGATASKPVGTFSVPDYPDGSTIPLYGVYRERSLVFIEQYVDGTGTTKSKVVYSHPWNQYTNYPLEKYQTDSEGNYGDLTESGSGYAFAGWYVGSTTIDSSRAYPENVADYEEKIKRWKGDADVTNGYDINVYTAYVAQQTISFELGANANPTASEPNYSHTLPGSMQDGTLSYQILNWGGPSDLPGSADPSDLLDSPYSGPLNFVSVADMTAHQYDSTWGSSEAPYTANNTVAVGLTLEKADANPTTPESTPTNTITADVMQYNKAQVVTNQDIGKDWKLKLTLYHSKVMTQKQEFRFAVKYTFKKKTSSSDPTGDDPLGHQWLRENITVELTPSQYEVDYQVNLPEPEESLKLTQSESGEFKASSGDAGTQVYHRVVTQNYESPLLAANETLALEGYTREANWKYPSQNGSAGASTPLNLTTLTIDSLGADAKKAELSNGKITISAGYVPVSYNLKKEGKGPNDNWGSWDITYGDGAGDTGTPTKLGDPSTPVKYHSTVTFKAEGQTAAYIWLSYTNDKEEQVKTRLDHYAAKQDDGFYTFAMPASNVAISYSDVMELYLDKGTIELFPDGFRQTEVYGDKLISWPGDYRIWQDEANNIHAEGDTKGDFHPTVNVLEITGDMTKRPDGTNADRKISLGNLNITSDNSIKLVDATKIVPAATPAPTAVNLTQEGNIEAKNILVPKNTSLKLVRNDSETDSTQNETITLTPKADRAAIGASATEGDPQNGAITLENVDVSMTLNAPSVSSGIGSGNQDAANSTYPCGNISIKGSRIAVTESASTSDQYKGAWIGGTGVPNVAVSDTSLLDMGSTRPNHNAKAVDGVAVRLSGCLIGEISNPVKEPIHAKETLNISQCEMYLKNEYPLGEVSMVGTLEGTTTIDDGSIDNGSVVRVDYANGGSCDELFTGQLLIEDARSDVTIDGVQVVEVGNGHIDIDTDGVTQTPVAGDDTTQDPVEHNHNGLSYLLLGEKSSTGSTSSGSAPDVVISGLGADETITIQQPVQPSSGSTKNVTIGSLTVNSDAKVILDGNLVVNDAATVEADKKLTVESPNAGSVSEYGVTYEKGLGGDGNYIQTGGTLAGTADVVVGGDMTLAGVTANCADHNIGSNGGNPAILGDDGAVTTPSTATTVTISGSSVTAATIGACGKQNDTFTFVNKDSTSTINGKLVQDHYRIAYDIGSLRLELKDTADKSLPTVLRTQIDDSADSIDPLNGIPANPTGDDTERFNCWYILNGAGTERLGLLNAGTTWPSGLHGRTALSGTTESKDMSAAAADGTRTLIVHAWVNPSGTARITNSRVFEDFEVADGDGNTASISQRGAWTARLESNGAYVTGRDYQVTFGKTLPAGTDLTLTVVAADGVEPDTNAAPNKYYHYTVPAGGKNTVKFSDFTKMGATTAAPPVFINREIGESETFLLSADFGEAGAAVDSTPNTVTFSLIPNEGAALCPLGNSVSYKVSEVTSGVITATGSSVDVSIVPAGEERLVGSNVYLVGTLTKTTAPVVDLTLKVPLKATAKLTPEGGTGIDGTWINGNTVAFELGGYGSNSVSRTYPFTFQGLDGGEYRISWNLCAGNATNAAPGDAPGTAPGAASTPLNIVRDVCSNTASSDLSVTSGTEPMLEVTCDQAQNSRVFNVTDQDRSVAFDCTANADSRITVTLEKQNALLGGFTPIEGLPSQNPSMVTVTSDPQLVTATANVAIPTDKGTYRVRFSLKDGSKNDDVYYTFIVR